VSIPDELIKAQKQVDLCIDTFFVNQMPFLSTISRRIYYRTCQWIKSREVDTYQECFIKVLKLYKSAGFQVATVSADREFVAVLDPIKEQYKFTTNYASAQEHVPEVERSNRVIKERVRATVHRSPYACLPRTVLKFVVTEAARKLNFFPAQYGCSAYYSPRQILHHVNLHYQHQCAVPMLAYGLAHHEPNPTNTPEARGIDSLYLRPTESQQVGHMVFDLNTQQVITRSKFTPVPITSSVIAQVEAIAKADGMKDLKITSKTGKILYDSTLIAGVDYDTDEEEEQPAEQPEEQPAEQPEDTIQADHPDGTEDQPIDQEAPLA
jgi:hypothetical protein